MIFILNNEINSIAKEEFSHLNKKRFNQIKQIREDKAKIYVVCKNEEVVSKIRETVNFLDYNFVGQSNNGEKAYNDIKSKTPDMVFIGLDLEGKCDGIELGHKFRD